MAKAKNTNAAGDATVTAAAPAAAPIVAGNVSGEQVTAAAEARDATPKDSKNGVTRPAPTSKTGQVWVIADKISTEKKAAAERKEVLDACKAAGINDATAQTQYGRWRKYYGLVSAKAPAATAAPAATVSEPAAPAAPSA